jgi:hypothetical protein
MSVTVFTFQWEDTDAFIFDGLGATLSWYENVQSTTDEAARIFIHRHIHHLQTRSASSVPVIELRFAPPTIGSSLNPKVMFQG